MGTRENGYTIKLRVRARKRDENAECGTRRAMRGCGRLRFQETQQSQTTNIHFFRLLFYNPISLK